MAQPTRSATPDAKRHDRRLPPSSTPPPLRASAVRAAPQARQSRVEGASVRRLPALLPALVATDSKNRRAGGDAGGGGVSAGTAADDCLALVKVLESKGAHADTVIDLSCQYVTAAAAVRLSALRLPMATELDLSGAIVDVVGIHLLGEFLALNPAIETVRVDGAAGSPPGGFEGLVAQGRDNAALNARRAQARREQSARRAADERREELRRGVDVIVHDEAADRSALEHTWRRDSMMVRRAWAFAQDLGREADAAAERDQHFLFELGLMLKHQASIRRSISEDEHGLRMSLFAAQYEASFRRASEAERDRELQEMARVHHQDWRLQTRVVACREAKERLARVRVDREFSEGYRDLVADEAAVYATYFDEFELESAKLAAQWKDTRQRSDEEKRRSKTRADDERRDRLFKNERARQESFAALQQRIADIQQIETAEEHGRGKILRAEKQANAAVHELLDALFDFAAQTDRVVRALCDLSTLGRQRPSVCLVTSVSAASPCLVFEAAGEWSLVDQRMRFAVQFPPAWYKAVHAQRDVCQQNATNARSVRGVSARIIRAAFDKWVESAGRVGVDLRSQGLDASPTLAEAAVTNESMAAPRGAHQHQVRVPARISRDFPLLFGDDFTNLIAGALDMSPIDDVAARQSALGYVEVHVSLDAPAEAAELRRISKETEHANLQKEATDLGVPVPGDDDDGADPAVMSISVAANTDGIDEISALSSVIAGERADTGIRTSFVMSRSGASRGGSGEHRSGALSLASSMSSASGGHGAAASPTKGGDTVVSQSGSSGRQSPVGSDASKRSFAMHTSPSFVSQELIASFSDVKSVVGHDVANTDTVAMSPMQVVERGGTAVGLGDFGSVAVTATRPRSAALVLKFFNDAANDADSISNALAALTVRTTKTDFGIIRHDFVRVEFQLVFAHDDCSTTNVDASSRSSPCTKPHNEREPQLVESRVLPLCYVQRFFAPRAVTRRLLCAGPDAQPLGSPWIVRNLPFLAAPPAESMAAKTACDADDDFEAVAVARSTSALIAGGTMPTPSAHTPSSRASGVLRLASAHYCRPTVYFDDESVVAAGLQPIGFSDFAVHILVAAGYSAENDRVFIDCLRNKKVKFVSGVLSFEGSVVGHVEPGSFDADVPSQRHTLYLASGAATVQREALAAILDCLRFVNAAPTPIEGTRTVLVRVSPPGAVGSTVAFDVDVEAMDLPTTMTLERGKVFFFTPAAEAPPLRHGDGAAHPSTALAPGGLIEDPDTDAFEGGYFRTWLSKPRLGDHLWVANSDGLPCPPALPYRRLQTNLIAGSPACAKAVDSPLGRKSADGSASVLAESSNASAPASPTTAVTDSSSTARSPVADEPDGEGKPPTGRRSRRASVVHFGDFGDAADSAENTEEDDDEAWERAAAEGALSYRRRPGLVIVPFVQEQRLQGVTGAEHDVGLVAFNGRLIGHLLCSFMAPPDVAAPTSASSSMIAEAATTAMDQSVRGGGDLAKPQDAKSKLKRGVKLASFANKADAHATSHLAGVSAVRVEFVNTGEATIAAAQAILRALRYTHTRPHHAKAGARDCVIEVVIGETQNRVDAQGNVIVSDNQNEPLIGTVQVCITAPLLRPMARGSVMELSYLENSGTKRLPLMDVYADDDVGSGSFDPNDASISFFVSKHPTALDLATIRALEEKEFVVEGGKITVIEAADEAQLLKERLAVIPPEMFAALDTKALLPAQRHRLNPHAPNNNGANESAIIIRQDSTALGGNQRVGTMRLPPGGMSATDALVKSSTTGTFSLKRHPPEAAGSRRVTISQADGARNVPATIPYLFPFGAAHNPASKRALSMIDGRHFDDDCAPDVLAASRNGSLAGSFRGGDESGFFGGDQSVLGASAGLVDDEDDRLPLPEDLEQRFQLLDAALELRRRGVRSPFRSYLDRLMAFTFMRDRAVMAVAYIAPSAAVIVPRVPIKRKDMAFFLRSFSYANPDPNPRHLLKQARVSVSSGGCEAQCVFDLKIIPVDDPLEIFIYNSAVHHRLGAAETTAVSEEVAAVLKAQREQHAPFAADDERLREARVGATRPFPLGGIKLYDPDTERWDRGSIQVDLTTTASRTDFVGFLTPEMQLRQYVLSNREPGLLVVLRTNDQPCFNLSALYGGEDADADDAYLRLVEAGHAAVPGAPSAVVSTVPLGPGGGARAIDVYDCRSGSLAHPVHVGIATAKIESRAASMVTTITFRKPRTKDEEQVVDCDILTYMHNAMQLQFGTPVPFPGLRQIKLTVADGQNPVPGRAQMTINVAPVAAVEKDRKLPQLTISATRTKAPADLHSCFGKAQFGLGDTEVYHDGCIEVVLVKAAHELDALVLKLNGSHMMLKDDVVIAGKDVVGRIVANTARYIRFQFAKNGRGPTGKRLVEITKNVFASVQAGGVREIALVLTEGPVPAPVGDTLLGARPAADSPKALALSATSTGKGGGSSGGKTPKTASPQAASLSLAAAAVPKPPGAVPTETAAPPTDVSSFACILNIAPSL